MLKQLTLGVAEGAGLYLPIHAPPATAQMQAEASDAEDHSTQHGEHWAIPGACFSLVFSSQRMCFLLLKPV